MKPSFSTAEIESIYREHPMQGKAILARVTGEMVRDRPLRESDLAGTGGDTATDQNHPGGAEYVRQLARLANIEPGCRVLDVGCGLGGSARILAEEFGCQVDGVEPETRYQDANRLRPDWWASTIVSGLSRGTSCPFPFRNITTPLCGVRALGAFFGHQRTIAPMRTSPRHSRPACGRRRSPSATTEHKH